jgi:hypothetical protein
VHATDKSQARLAAVNPHHHSDFMDTLILKDYGKNQPSLYFCFIAGLAAARNDGEEDDESADNDIFTPERPTSWTHCF